MFKKRIHHEITADINITPFTDVVLVLLVIFLIATPLLLMEGLRTDLPSRNQASQPVVQKTTFITIAIAESGAVTVNGQPCPIERLTPLLRQLIASNPDSIATIGAEPEALYDDLVRVIDGARAAGVMRYVLVK